MQFYEPSQLMLLWILPLLLGLFLGGEREWKRRLSKLGNASFVEARLFPGFSRGRRRVAWLFVGGVFCFSILALARPQWGEEKKRIERKGADLIFLLDTSLSMLAEDIKPNRLEKSKLEIKNILHRLEGDRVGMVAFAGSSFLQCPLTLDYAAFMLFVDTLKPGYIPNPGTSLSQAMSLGTRAFPPESRKYRALIVFSDGEDHEGGMEEAIQFAQKSGVRIYTVGVGAPEGEPIPLRSASNERVSGYKKDRDGQVVITRLNAELLERIAQETGGLYLAATPSEKEVEVILKHLETLGERKLKERLISEREDRFQLFLLVAFLFLVGASLLGDRRRGLAKAALPFLAWFLLTGFLDTPRSLVDKGNRLVKEKKYQSAVEDYRKAEVRKPNHPIIRYNLGTALYELYEYRDAEKELEQALLKAKDPGTKAKVLYNYGNTKYRLGDFEKAIEAYKQVLEIDPKDEDAKYNLEFLQKKKAAFEKKNEERQKDQKQQKSPQPREQPQQSSASQESREQREPSSGEKQQEQQSSQAEQEEQQQKSQPQESQQGQGDEEEQSGQAGETEQQQGERGQPQEMTAEERKKEEKQKQQDEERQEAPQAGEKESRQPSGQGTGEPLQGQMGSENALRILNALQENEKKLQNLRRPPVDEGSGEVLKDW